VRIALLAPVANAVPPKAYGGVETVVAALAAGLVEAGHDVTLFASGDSKTNADVAAVFPEPVTRRGLRDDAETEHATACFLRAHEFDVVGSHAGVLAAALSASVDAPVVHTVSDALEGARTAWQRAYRFAPRLRVVAVSDHQRGQAPELPWVATCPNGVDVERYRFRSDPDDYAAFVGRMSPEKGCHLAIEAARRAGVPLRIAAKREEPHEREYFDECVRPHLGNGVEFVGEVTPAEKIELLGRARATLFPVNGDEAFGLVLVESLATGTPVVALRRAAVPEIVADGHTGFLVDHVGGIAGALSGIDALDRAECRREAERRFSKTALARAYASAYAEASRATRDPPTIASAPSSKRTQALPLPS
jgi:glycosyltransferase involved in cell wall biosynthesis